MGRQLVVALNVPIEFVLNFFAANREDSVGMLDRKGHDRSDLRIPIKRDIVKAATLPDH